MNERISRIVNHPSFAPVTVGIVSAGVGMGVGFLLGRRTSKTVHVIPAQEELIDPDELDTMVAVGKAQLGVKEEPDFDEEIVVPAPAPISDDERIAYGAEMVAKTLKREMTSTHRDEPDVVTTAEFAASDEDWDLEKEVASRNSNRPYVIHYDEYFAKEMEEAGYLQMAMTYYAGDNILVDPEDKPLYNHAEIVGDLSDQAPDVPNAIFGHGSKGDPSVVYIRNDKRKIEFEVCRDPGHYTVEVMGLDLENGGERPKRLAHSKVDKFRPDD